MLRTLILGDIHLFRQTPRAVIDDLTAVIESHPGARFIFAGDWLDLSAEGTDRGIRRAAEEAILAHAPLRTALARHLDASSGAGAAGAHGGAGGELWLVSGNHDTEVGVADFGSRLADMLGLPASARSRVRTTPWFFRHGGLHVEHGHLYDPDNAPAHPLEEGTSLGVHFVEEFIAKTSAHRYLNSNDGTPLKLFLSSWKWYGVRAPHVIYRFFHTAYGALQKSGSRFLLEEQRSKGHAKLPGFADWVGVPQAMLDELLSATPTPTLASARATFARCYLDRVLATLSVTGGMSALACGHPIAGGAALSAGALGLLASWATGYDRYTGSVVERLAEGAARVSDVTGAKLVVFGHTHREALGDRYANTGSFSFPGRSPGRPYLEIEGLEIEGPSSAPRAVRRYTRAT